MQDDEPDEEGERELQQQLVAAAESPSERLRTIFIQSSMKPMKAFPRVAIMTVTEATEKRL